jgi:hypothetical protein
MLVFMLPGSVKKKLQKSQSLKGYEDGNQIFLVCRERPLNKLQKPEGSVFNVSTG